MLLDEVVPHRLVDLAFVLVIARRESTDVRVGDSLIVVDPGATVDTDPPIAVFDEDAHPRIRRAVPVLDPSLRAVDDDLVAVDEVPHDREVRRAIGILGSHDREALLLEELPLRWIYLGARH